MEIPREKIEEAKEMVELKGEDYYKDFQWLENVEPLYKNNLVE